MKRRMKVPVLLVLALFLSSCREKQVIPSEAVVSLLWEVAPGDEWVYEVEASYPKGSQPRLLEGELRREREGRILVEFERRKIAQGRREVKKGKGHWEVIRVMRGSEVEEYEYLEITPEAVSYRGSKKEGLDPGPVKSLSIPLDLVRRDMEGGESWEYELGSGVGNVRRFRVAGTHQVVVAAGTFEASKIMVEGRSRNLDVKEVYWFNSRVGFVKIEKSFYALDGLLKREVMELKKGPLCSSTFPKISVYYGNEKYFSVFHFLFVSWVLGATNRSDFGCSGHFAW